VDRGVHDVAARSELEARKLERDMPVGRETLRLEAVRSVLVPNTWDPSSRRIATPKTKSS
jgi:hypothetical protein